jgi:hypothetical protein
VVTKNLSKDSRSQCRNLYPRPLEYEAGVLTSVVEIDRRFRGTFCLRHRPDGTSGLTQIVRIRVYIVENSRSYARRCRAHYTSLMMYQDDVNSVPDSICILSLLPFLQQNVGY